MTSGTLHITLLDSTLIHVLGLGFAGFLLSTILTPLYTTIAYKRKWWKQQRSEAWSGGAATIYNKLHAAKHKRHIPTMAGLIFIFSIAVVTLTANLSRSQTWLPLAGMVAAGAVGLLDDLVNIHGSSSIAGMQAKTKFALHALVALVGGVVVL